MPNFGVGKCVVCLMEFQRGAPCGTCCSPECAAQNKTNMKKKWDMENKEYVKEYSCNYHPINIRLRKIRRQTIYDIWGRDGRKQWQLAEDIAVDVLNLEGYEDIKLITTYFRASPFDIVCFKDNQGYFFQVTSRTHTQKKTAHKVARDLRFIHKVLFVSPYCKKYIIKDFSPGGICELGIQEVETARRFS